MQAFVKFLENESQPRNESVNTPMLLNIVHPNKSSSSDSANTSATSVDGQVNNPSGAVQPILLSDAMLQSFSSPRNSSSILKDILSDS